MKKLTIIISFLALTSLCCSMDGVVQRMFPYAAGGITPCKEQTGPRIRMKSVPGGTLSAGYYSGKCFTTLVSLDPTGTYCFYDCEFQAGFDTIYGGPDVTRYVILDHCNVLEGLYFTNGGQKDWLICWSYIRSNAGTALRTHNTDYVTPTPFEMTDTIVEITSVGSPSEHVTAMQDLGGCWMTFIRVKFIVPGPLIDGVTGQTAVVTNIANDTLFDSCDFLLADAYYYTVYAAGDNVLFRNCRFGRGQAGYLFPNGDAQVVFKGCIDLSSKKTIIEF